MISAYLIDIRSKNTRWCGVGSWLGHKDYKRAMRFAKVMELVSAMLQRMEIHRRISVPRITGWWFHIFGSFHNIWDNPSHWLIFSRWFDFPSIIKPSSTIRLVTIWLFNIAMERSTIFNRSTIYFYGPFPMAMLNNQRVGCLAWGGSWNIFCSFVQRLQTTNQTTTQTTKEHQKQRNKGCWTY